MKTGASVRLARFSSSLWSGVEMGPPDPILGKYKIHTRHQLSFYEGH